jgi:hypothetical protein
VEEVLEAPPRYVAIVDVPTSSGRQHAVDVFELGEEGIVRLEIHSRVATDDD